MIRAVKETDAKAIVDIYNYYIKDTVVTFELDIIDEQEMQKRIQKVTKDFSWIVFEEDGEILGYAYGSLWRERIAYKRSLETTVYLKHTVVGRGIGTMLYVELLKRLKELDIKVAIGCIALPNEASVKLHEKLGFRKVGIFHEVGYKFDSWIDVGFWELKL